MLPLHAEEEDGKDDGSSYSTLSETIAWGTVAECSISVCCPLVMYGTVDVTGTSLNLIGPLLGGMACAVDKAADSASVRRSCAAFQAGFIGVLTSFSFMVDQGAQLAASPSGLSSGLAYIVATMAAGCAVFAVGHGGTDAVLRSRPGRRLLMGPRSARAPPHLQRLLLRRLVFAAVLAWLWVLCTPAGAVFDPQDVHAAHRAAGHVHQSGVLAPASKRMDMAHLACGIGLQAVGLAVSAHISGRSSERHGVHWGALACNTLACVLLLALRLAEAASYLSEHATFPCKLRTSGCGALSISGGLAPLIVGEANDGRPRSRSPRRTAQADVSFALHAYVAAVTCAMLSWLTAHASGET